MWSKKVFPVVAAGLLATTACSPAAKHGVQPTSAPKVTATAAKCPPSSEDIREAATRDVRKPDYDGGTPHSDRQVELVKFHLVSCDNNAAVVNATVAYRDPGTEVVQTQEEVEVTACDGRWNGCE